MQTQMQPEIDPRYPIGKYQKHAPLKDHERAEMIESLAVAPAKFRDAVKGLNEEQLDTPYRDGGWTVRQLIHHVADSHMNSYCRFRFAVTEAEPTVKAYDEKMWAELFDARTAPVELSLNLIDSLHARWVMMLNSLRPIDFMRTMKHPEHGSMTLDDALALYEWHGRHHAAHITTLRAHNSW